jgi:DDE superfamily endonuclease/Tc5 transposase DNA-binding domain
MPRKRSVKAAQSRASIETAFEAYISGKYKSVYATAKALGVSETTLRARVNGRGTYVDVSEDKQLLSKAEETMPVKRCTELTKNGFPPRKRTIEEMAMEIIRRRVRKINDEEGMELVHYPPIGKDWVRRFLNRHTDLKVKRARRIDAARVKEVSSEKVTEWFDSVKEVIREYKIKPENMYNMDETGFSIGSTQAGHVVVDDTVQSQFQAQPGRQEWVTVLECICGDGSTVAPLVIFKGENGSTGWVQSPEVPGNWRFSASQNGWTSNQHGLEWLRQCFDPDTREKADGDNRLLILDGHGSHVTGSFIMHCMNHRITLMRLPPHTSHVLEPLDVGLFGPLKTALSKHQDNLFRLQVARIRKVEWLIAYVKARQTAFRPDNVFGGWRGAGLLPLNPKKVLRQLEPKTPPTSRKQILFTSTPDNVIMLETSLIDSSPPDATELKRTNTAFRRRLGLETPLKTPERGYAFRLSFTAEKLQAQVSILQHENTELKQLNAQRKEQTKGIRVALKDRLLLTAEELRETVRAMQQEEEEKQKKKAEKPRKSRKRKAQEMEAPAEEEVNRANNDIQP